MAAGKHTIFRSASNEKMVHGEFRETKDAVE